MARILLVSKFRSFQGGVERHIHDLMNGLAERGHTVRLFSSEDVEAAGGAVFSAATAASAKYQSLSALMWNSRARELIRNVAKAYQPDVVHYHSISHQLSPSVLGAFDSPSVMTLHDYKMAAPCYTLVREGQPCEECVGRAFATPAIRYKCVSGSSAGSALCAFEGLIHSRRYRSEIGRFIVPSRFAFDIALRSGLPADRLSIIPWGVAPSSGKSYTRGKQVAFFGGRLHRSKGLQVLLSAWQSLPPGHGCSLRIAGEGELEPLVRRVVAQDITVEFLGLLQFDAIMKEVAAATVAVVPSLSPETMGLSALEALAAGTPLLASGRGALADLSGPGVWTLLSMEPSEMRNALIELLIEGQAEELRKALGGRNLSTYSLDRMIDAIEAEYRRASEEYWTR